MRVLWVIILLSTIPAGGAEPVGVLFFEQKIRPVLVDHCYSCHSAHAEKLKSGLYLDSKSGWEKGGDGGEAVIVPGRPQESLLLQAIRHDDPDLAMPPKKPRLPDSVIADFTTWIKMGAPDPRIESAAVVNRADKGWWSLQPIATTFCHRSIDGFVTEKLHQEGLEMNPPADARTLVRRMTYDLTGLPPSFDEVKTFEHAFSRDPAEATAALADRLLASPEYGEHWGRHWLDVVRFGESIGFERNVMVDDLWPFRDYVIRSLSEDKPFNRFIAEHLAGDSLAQGRPEIEIGSAFLVAGPYDDVGNDDATAQKNIRAATLDELITTTSGAFLGLTMNCARCHDHKFDPVLTEDYYRLRAAFEGVKHGRRVIATADEKAAFKAADAPLQEKRRELLAKRDALNAAIDRRAAAALDQTVFPRPRIDVRLTEETFAPIEARYIKLVVLSLVEPTSRTRPDGPPRVGNKGTGRLMEFEAWSSGPLPRNVALAANGGTAKGARATKAEDFPEAYGPQLCIDGVRGEQWFIGEPAELVVTFAQPEIIDRITFSNANDESASSRGLGSTPCEYEIQVSADGSVWTTVASGNDRAPWTREHGIERMRRGLITPEETAGLSQLERELKSLDALIAAVPPLPKVFAGIYTEPEERTYVQKGGDPLRPGGAVLPESPGVLDRTTAPFRLEADAPEASRRLALARWITHETNPLTPRVLANRVWHYHFGAGIVDTPSDFGYLGGRPSHPELLDYLAARLVANGWRLKALHREILLSRTYAQSGEFRAAAARIDKDARLLWRFPPRRLGAEEIRDTLLATAGVLRREPRGGPGFRLYRMTQNNVATYFPLDHPGPETYRRSVYHQNARASVVDILSDFDLPDIAFAAPKRANTTTPLQALTMLNHPFMLDMARAFSARIQGPDPITKAYEIAYQRSPTAAQRIAAENLIAQFGHAAFCRALLNSSELVYLE